MKRITITELEQKINDADKVEYKGTTNAASTKTRHGSYITIRKGLSSSCWFMGFDTLTNTIIVENVG